MTLEEALSLKDGEVVSLVGAGGKTTLMFALGDEISSRGKGVVLTTTTKIREPAASSSFSLFLSTQLGELKKWVGRNLERSPCLVIARGKHEDGKLQGVSPEWVAELQTLRGVSFMIVEADGASGRSLKAPREGEPVIPQCTTLLIPVVGIDSLSCPLEEQYVFRSAIAARLLGVAMGSKITEGMIARLISEISKDRPGGARVVPFINKVDLPGGLEKARGLAQVLLNIDQPTIERVILGQAQNVPRVKEIFNNPDHGRHG